MNSIILRKEIIKICQKIYEKGFVANHEGNVSARIGERIICTPTAMSKAEIKEEMLLTLDLEGKKIAGRLNPFSEIDLHLICYRVNPKIKAICHAHPPYATAYGICGKEFKGCSIPEFIVSIGERVPLIPLLMPKDKKIAEYLASLLPHYHAFLLGGNGVLTVGDDPEQAFLRLEHVEQLAKISYLASPLGPTEELSQNNVKELLEKRAKTFGYETPPGDLSLAEGPLDLKKIISEEVKKALKC